MLIVLFLANLVGLPVLSCRSAGSCSVCLAFERERLKLGSALANQRIEPMKNVDQVSLFGKNNRDALSYGFIRMGMARWPHALFAPAKLL